MEKLNALILAGGDDRPFFLIDGRPMVSYVLDALYGSNYIGSIAIAGDIARLKASLGCNIDYYIEGGSNLFESVKGGIMPFTKDNHILIITSDIPMIMPHMIDEFIEECQLEYADFYYPIVEKSINEIKFPNCRRTYVKLKEGWYTGGNLVCIAPGILDRCQSFIYDLTDNRKEPWKIGMMLGFRILSLFMMGKLTIPIIESRIQEILNVVVKAIIMDHGEIANDVDEFADIKSIIGYFDV